MLWLSIAILVLTFVTVMLVAGNNLSACVGPAIGSRIISKRFGMLLGAAGFSLGLVIQGIGMTKTVNLLAAKYGSAVSGRSFAGGDNNFCCS